MDFKDFEQQLNNVNTQISTLINQINNDQLNKKTTLFDKLKANIEQKRQILESLENQIHSDNETFETELKEIESLIHDLKIQTHEPKHDLEAKRLEFDQIKFDEMKAFQTTQRRKRSEIIHKINNLNKELTSVLKDNVNNLNEEEKNHRLKEQEIIRRMNIDLNRSNDANVKEYSDIEKKLLEINDTKGINDAKRKINKIRVIGFHEQASIKNKYDFQIFENSLDFKKYYEKNLLDSALISEEFNLKLKALDNQKNEIEYNDSLKIATLDLEYQKRVLDIEKENKIFEIENKKITNVNLFSLKKQSSIIRTNQNQSNYEHQSRFLQELNHTDSEQVKAFSPFQQSLTDDLKQQIDFIISSLANTLEIFKVQLISLIRNAWNVKKQTQVEFIQLLTHKIEAIVLDKTYLNHLNSLECLCDDFYKDSNNRFLTFTTSLNTIFKVMLIQIEELLRIYHEYQKEEVHFEKTYHKKIYDTLQQGYNNSSNSAKDQYEVNNNKINAFLEKSNQEKKTQDDHLNEAIKAEVALYHENIKTIDEKRAQLEYETKAKINHDHQNYEEYVLNRKSRITNLKQSYNKNINHHKRVLEKKYKYSLKQNEKEKKFKIKGL